MAPGAVETEVPNAGEKALLEKTLKNSVKDVQDSGPFNGEQFPAGFPSLDIRYIIQ